MELKTSILAQKIRTLFFASIGLMAGTTAQAQNVAPYFVNPTPAANSTIVTTVGNTVNFHIRGKDNTGQTVTLSSTTLPAGVVMNPSLPTSTTMQNNGSKVNSHFSWTPGIADIGLHTITYTLTDNGTTPMSATRTINILVNGTVPPCSLSVQTTVQNVSCNGGNNGSVMTTVTSPFTGPLSYNWSNNATTSGQTNLMAGNYTVVVTDANGCMGVATATVTQPQPLTIGGTATNFSCNAANNGMVDITVSGGTGPYSYSWSNAAITEDLTGVLPGTYSVAVTDANGCSQTATFNVGPVVPTTIVVTGTATNFSCNAASNGMVDITATGGTGPYTFLWNNNAVTEDIMNLQPGTYSVTATDALGCTGTASFTVGAPVPTILTNTFNVGPTFQGQAPNTIYTNYGPSTLNITAMPAGGSGFTYSWATLTNPAVMGTGATLAVSPTMTTSYVVTVMDATGCILMDTITINVVDVSCSGNKVKVCHKAASMKMNTLCISSSAVAAHLAHGDILGDCTMPMPQSLNSTLGQPELNILPNPNNGQFTVSLPAFGGDAELMVTDVLTGRTLQTRVVHEGTPLVPIDLTAQPSGIYLIQLVTEDQRHQARIMLQK